MIAENVMEMIAVRGADLRKLTGEALRNHEVIPALVDGLGAPKAAIKYGCDKILRRVAEAKPKLVYPYFDRFVELLDCENNFLRWGAIQTISHLVAADSKNKFEKIFHKYYSAIQGPVMVAAANAIGSSPRIAAAKPKLRQKIVNEILKVENARYYLHDKLSPECRKVACGHALAVLREMYPFIENRKPVIAFVQRQRRSSRASVRKDAEELLAEMGGT